MIGSLGIQLSMQLVRRLKTLARIFVHRTKMSEKHSAVVNNKMSIVTSAQVVAK